MTASGPPGAGSAWEVLRAFTRMGVTSFGGPIAHLGYFRDEFVAKRRWLDDQQYADLVALCQFLPGPASSQVGFSIGLQRAGLRGALAAFVGFTLPSALLMVGFAYGTGWFGGTLGAGALTGLKLVAVAIVAQAVLGMTKTLTPDRPRASIAALAAVGLLIGGGLGQLAAIAMGALIGVWWCRSGDQSSGSGLSVGLSRRFGIACLAGFVALGVAGPVLADLTGWEWLRLFDAFYRSGALVFGGGHVVLPLLQASVVDPGWVSSADFLAGYGAAQAVPGPLFTLASALGAVSTMGPGGPLGALIAVLGIFTPGLLLVLGVLPFWAGLSSRPWARAGMRGANAAVVGILATALWTPVFTTAVTSPARFALAVLCFVLLIAWKLPSWLVVLVGALAGMGLAWAGWLG